MKTRIIGLVDCDSFFASCEKVFRPDWERRPVVVLSNNDGCVVARSPEAKALQIPMGEPYFRLKNFARERGVVVRSANYALYGDMSRRVMETLGKWTENVDAYSIDEAFLDLTSIFCGPDGRYPDEDASTAGVETLEELRERVREWPDGPALGEIPDGTRAKVEALAEEITRTIRKWTGIPVSLGLGPTRALAKAASRLAKDEFERTGKKYAALFGKEERIAALRRLPVGKVWGVGRRLSPRLERCGVRTAYDLAKLDPTFVRDTFSICEERLVRELRGELMFDVDTSPAPQKTLQYSRSFGETIATLEELEQPTARFANRIATKLRARGLVASALGVYITTNRFNERAAQRNAWQTTSFPRPTNASPEIVGAALRVLREIYREGYEYKKAGVTALEICDAGAAAERRYLFEPDPERDEKIRERDRRVSEAFDKVNARFGRGALFFAAEGANVAWRPRSDFVSPCYTTDWNDLPVAVMR